MNGPKIRGQFEDIPLLESADAMAELIGRARWHLIAVSLWP